MSKGFALVLILVFLTASFLIMVKPASSSTSTAENTWTEKAPMPTARGYLGVAVVDGKIYAIGGLSQNDFSGQLLGTNEEYDPTTNTWVTRAPMPTPRMDFAIAVYNNQIYCMGGVSGLVNHPGLGASIVSSVNEVYDPATDSWTSKTSLPYATRGIMASVIGGKIYIIMSAGSWEPVLVYDPSTDSWKEEAMDSSTVESWDTAVLDAFNETDPYAAAVNKMTKLASAAVGDDIYVVPVNYRALVIYDSLTGNWSVGMPPPSEITGSAAAVATNGSVAPQQIYFQGPTANYAYNPNNASWQVGVPMTINRIDFGIVSLDDQLYVIGGYTGDTDNVNSSATNEKYIPFGYGTVPVVSIVFPENTRYNESNVGLILAVDGQISWLGYSLDGKHNVTITGNTTLTGLSNGVHNVTVYAEGNNGSMGAFETVSFTIAVPFPTETVTAVSVAVSVVAVAAGLLVYFKKRKHSLVAV